MRRHRLLLRSVPGAARPPSQTRSLGVQDKERLEAQLKEMQGVVAKMQASRGDDQAKARAALERAAAAEAEAKQLRAAAAQVRVRC